MRSIHTWLTEYGESHQNALNKTIHWICVPTIFFSIVTFFYSIKLPFTLIGSSANVAQIALILVALYYLFLSLPLALGMIFFSLACYLLCGWLENLSSFPLWGWGLILFALAWVGQFYGHHIEGKKPSFLKDLQFLMIGPAWLLSFIYKKLGIKY